MQMQNSDRSNRPTVKRSSNASIMNQVSKVAGPLLRRQSLPGLEVLKMADSSYQKAEAAEDVSNVTYDLKVHQLGENPRLSPFQVLQSKMDRDAVSCQHDLLILFHLKQHKSA